MAVVNTIKLSQIDTGQLGAFLSSGLGISFGTNLQHIFTEQFLADLGVGGNLSVTGNFITKGGATFESGLYANSGIQVAGTISGQNLKIDNFSIPTGSIGTATFGSCSFTGVPIYESGSAALGNSLVSGSLFGLKQRVSEPTFIHDTSGNLLPNTGIGTTVVMLCISMGS